MANPCSNAGHPGNNYFVNLATGTIQQQSGILGNVIGLAGYYGPMDWCQAKAFAANYTSSGALHGSAEAHAAGAAAGSLTGINAIGAFFSALGEANTWIRVAKVLIGGAMLLFGLVHMTGADSAAARTVKTIPLPI